VESRSSEDTTDIEDTTEKQDECIEKRIKKYEW
jgi:hypothetical protein